jgi:predicted flavoprotein YhiN
VSGHYDAIVIGAGPGGQHCAGRLANGGMREYLESKGIELLRGGAQLAGAGRVVSNCSLGTFSSSACLARSRHSARAVVAGEWHRALVRSRWPAS